MHEEELEGALFEAKSDCKQAALGAISSLISVFNFKAGLCNFFQNLIAIVVSVKKLSDCLDKLDSLKEKAEVRSIHKLQCQPEL
ncbi:MAG: hypothetical protein AAF530_20060 [Pseudomonadota bacterium]